MKRKMDDQENIKRLREIVEPCKRCGGRGYVIRMMTHPRDGLVEEREFCGCINANLPIPEIKDGRLNFTMEENESYEF